MTNTAKRTKIAAELAKMKVGFCGSKFDCMVWRVSESGWIIGRDTVSLHDVAFDLESSAMLIDNLTLNVKA